MISLLVKLSSTQSGENDSISILNFYFILFYSLCVCPDHHNIYLLSKKKNRRKSIYLIDGPLHTDMWIHSRHVNPVRVIFKYESENVCKLRWHKEEHVKVFVVSIWASIFESYILADPSSVKRNTIMVTFSIILSLEIIA